MSKQELFTFLANALLGAAVCPAVAQRGLAANNSTNTLLRRGAWIGSYSAYLTPEVFHKHFSQLAEKQEVINQQLQLLWLAVGTEDFLYKQAVAFDELLKEKKIEHKSLGTGGGHAWMNARHYLAETLPLYFK